MADYWKSQPKKFCQYCKCWIADNKPSIEFHERGKNHKQNVAAKIEEIKKNSIAKAKKEEKMSKEFAAMEEAAVKAYGEDMKRLKKESVSTGASKSRCIFPQAQEIKVKATTQHISNTVLNAWILETTDNGHTYYYNTITRESQWETPDGFQAEYVPPITDQTWASSSSAWVNAVTPEGYVYYYNSSTGESTWEKPDDFSPKDQIPSEENVEHEVHSTPESKDIFEREDTNKDSAKDADTQLRQVQPPKISFRVRNEEAITVMEKEEKTDEEKFTKEPKKEFCKESSVPAEEVETPAKKQRIVNQYGKWESIRQQDPYDYVDLQLPQMESCASASSDLPPEPKTKFKEKIITSIEESSVGATFKNRKAENGKSRSLRQRGKNE